MGFDRGESGAYALAYAPNAAMHAVRYGQGGVPCRTAPSHASSSRRSAPPHVAGVRSMPTIVLVPGASTALPLTVSRVAYRAAQRAGVRVEAPPRAPPPAPAWGKPRAWASASTSSARGRSALVATPHAMSEHRPRTPELLPTPAPKSWTARKAVQTIEQLYAEAHQQTEAPLTVPTGLINQGNSCFASVVRCHYSPDFANARVLSAFIHIPDDAPRDPAPRPEQLDASSRSCVRAADLPSFRFYSEIPLQQGSVDLEADPILPDFIYDAMRLDRRFDLFQLGHQEDAEEFFSLVLSTLHDEVRLVYERAMQRRGAPTAAAPPSSASWADAEVEAREVRRPDSPEQDQWLEVGQKGKTSLTRTSQTLEGDSPITRVFDGKLRSVLTIPGSKTSIVLEPYRSLPLDIQPSHVQTIEDALRQLTVPETISGVWSSGRHAHVDATKQVWIEMMPPVLVLHLKRFLYDEVGGVQKSCKHIAYGHTLTIPAETCSTSARQSPPPRYGLFGVVYHHGRLATGGHYTAAVLRQDGAGWVHIDDTYARPIPTEDVLRGDLCDEGIPSPAYLLFYQRL